MERTTTIDPSTARKRGLNARRSLTTHERHSHSLKISYRLSKILDRYGGPVAVYLANHDEANLSGLIGLLTSQRREVFAPVIEPHRQLRWRTISARHAVRRNRYNIREPRILDRYQSRIARATIDQVIAPLSAFDACNHRTGVGGGYYDRAIAKLRKQRGLIYIGAAFDVQKCHAIASKPWDQTLDIVVTERAVYDRRRFSRKKNTRLKPLRRKAKRQSLEMRGPSQ
ncbi:MAG: 5-formyltetrahydrofolate cyclo-ligase [Pseudomonadota bacterium]